MSTRKKTEATPKRKPMPDQECITELMEGLRQLHKTYVDGVRLVVARLSMLELKKVKGDARTLPTLDPADPYINTVQMLQQIMEDRIRERAELLLGKREQRKAARQRRTK